MNTNTAVQLNIGDAYRIVLGRGGSTLLKIWIEKESGSNRILLFGSGTPAPTYIAISENGDQYEVSAYDIGRKGIGEIQRLPSEPAATPSDFIALKAKASQRRVKEAQDRADEDARKAAEKIALPAKYPHLTPFATLAKPTSGYALGAANIRKELARAFPGQKFSVTSKSFSGGNSIDVWYEYGPTTEAVDKIISKFEQGSFDGSDDSYTYDSDRTFTDVFGGAKYVHSSRSIPTPQGRDTDWFGDSLYGDVGRALTTKQKVANVGIYTRNVFGEGDDRNLEEHVNIIISKTGFPTGFKREDFTGIVWSDSANRFKITISAEAL